MKTRYMYPHNSEIGTIYEIVELRPNEMTRTQINTASSIIYNNETKLVNDGYNKMYKLYNETSKKIDDRYKDIFTTTIKWQSVNTSMYEDIHDTTQYSCDVKINDGILDEIIVPIKIENELIEIPIIIEIEDVFCDGYDILYNKKSNITIDNLTLKFYANENIDEHAIIDAALNNSSVIEELDAFCDMVNENINDKIKLIEMYNDADDYVRNYIHDEIERGNIKVSFFYDPDDDVYSVNPADWVVVR